MFSSLLDAKLGCNFPKHRSYTSLDLIFKLEPTLEGLGVPPDLSGRVPLVCRTAYTTVSQAKTKKGIAKTKKWWLTNNSWAETPLGFTVPDDLRWSQMTNQSWKIRIHAFQQCRATHPIGSRSSLRWEAMPHPHRPRLMLMNVATGSAFQMYITYHSMTCSWMNMDAMKEV